MISNRRVARSIRTLARNEMRGSKVLWKEYRRVREPWWRRALRPLRFVLLAYVLAVGVIVVEGKAYELPLVMLTLYSTATILTRASLFSSALYASWDLAFFMHHPVPDVSFFKLQWQKFIGRSVLVWIFSLFAFGYLAVTRGGSVLAAIAAATLQWVIVLSLAVLVLLGPAWKKVVVIRAPCYLLTIASPFIPQDIVELMANALVWLPTAWIPYVFDHGVMQGSRDAWYVLIPAFLLVLSLVPAAKSLRRRYPVVDLEYPLLSAEFNDDYSSYAATVNQEIWPQSSENGLLESLTATLELRPLDWNMAGWIERLIARWLTEREEKVADFLCGGHLGLWSGQWRRGVKIAGVGIAMILIPWSLPEIVYFALGALACMFGLPVLAGHWEGMQLRSIGDKVGPAHVGLPLSYDEISRVMAKVNLIRVAVWTPVLLLYASVLAWRTGSTLATGMTLGLVILLLMLVFQPITILGQHSYATNDTKRINIHLLLAFVPVAFLGVLLIACIIIFFVALSWAPIGARLLAAVAAASGMLLCSFLIWLCYRVVYNRGRVDLMRAPN